MNISYLIKLLVVFLETKYKQILQMHKAMPVSQCICGHLYYKHQRLDKLYRVHSTQSDQHRQKVVIETSTPKIVIDKIPHSNLKVYWRDKFTYSITLAPGQ
ncbi:unnamed protein product [Leptidea sinapis]|uniref:Uncharacterized protein n=1 Tax=Leptidea sinapis TaxID=189913 RepID=A0A5E4PRB4_9NEOP|nr:unnamed protein product [Leptidea sinapis]